MNSLSPTIVLGATAEAGVVLHDVLGVIGLVAAVAIGLFLRKHQSAQFHPELRQGSTMDRKFARAQIWGIYWLAVAAIIGFFFIMPRATRLKAQRTPGPSTVNQSGS